MSKMHLKSIIQCPLIDIIANYKVMGRKLIKLIMNSIFIDNARFSIKERWF